MMIRVTQGRDWRSDDSHFSSLMTFSPEDKVQRVQLPTARTSAMQNNRNEFFFVFSLFQQPSQARVGGRNDWLVWSGLRTVSFIMIHPTAPSPVEPAPTWSGITHPSALTHPHHPPALHYMADWGNSCFIRDFFLLSNSDDVDADLRITLQRGPTVHVRPLHWHLCRNLRRKIPTKESSRTVF